MHASLTMLNRLGADNVTALPAAVLRELEFVLESPPFRTSRQCQRLLRYIVEQTLDGHADVLRERVIGTEVFERRADYDPGQDPVVRIRAADVRKRLAQYYQTAHSTVPSVVIDVPPGSYRAVFRAPILPQHPDTKLPLPALQAASDQSGTDTPFPALAPQSPAVHKRVGLIVTLVVLIGAALVVVASPWLRGGRPEAASGIDQFWAPFLNAPQPVLLCLGTNAVYHLSDSYMAAYRRDHHIADNGAELFADLPPKTALPAIDLVPAPDTFVGAADASAAIDVVAMLVQHRKGYDERLSSDLSFADLRKVPAIFVGGFNNRWTLKMTGDLRFRLSGGHSIINTQTNRTWSPMRDRNGTATDDYALITRLVDAKTGAPLLTIAGIGTYGTQAAGEFVSSPTALARLARSAPQGWPQKNVQILLHLRVVEYAPSTTEVVAEHFW